MRWPPVKTMVMVVHRRKLENFTEGRSAGPRGFRRAARFFYGCPPSRMISLLSPSARPGTRLLSCGRSLGKDERSSHNPRSVAAAQVTEIIASC